MRTLLLIFFCFYFFAPSLSSQTLNLDFPSVNGVVRALASKGDTLFIGGSFIEVDEIPRTNLAAIDLNTGALLDWNPPVEINGMVDRITVHNNTIFICGMFEFFNRNTLAAFSAIDGSLELWNPDIIFPFIPPDFQTGRITGVEVYNDIIYLGGYFTSVNGESRNNLAAVDMDGNLQAWNPNTDIPIDRLSRKDNKLYLSGPFMEVNGQERLSFASFDLDDGTLTDWNPMTDNPGNPNTGVFLGFDGAFIFGYFSNVDGEIRELAAKVDTDLGATLPWTVGFSNAVPRVNAFASWQNQLFMGGFYQLDVPEVPLHLTSIDPETGAYLNWSATVDFDIAALLVANNKLIAGGDFTTVDTVNKIGLAVFDLDIIDAIEEPAFYDISVYPNPAQNQLNIQLETDIIKSIEIYDVQGVLKMNEVAESYTIQTIDLLNLSSGIYTVVFRGENYNVLSREMVAIVK